MTLHCLGVFLESTGFQKKKGKKKKEIPTFHNGLFFSALEQKFETDLKLL